MEDERMCAHGKLYEKPCEACEVVWHREMLDHAQASVAYHRRKLAQLRWAGYSKSSTLIPGRPMTDETSVIEAILNDVDNSGLPGCARIADISEARWQLLVERLAQALRESGEDGLTGNL